jgi:hypothetical protein
MNNIHMQLERVAGNTDGTNALLDQMTEGERIAAKWEDDPGLRAHLANQIDIAIWKAAKPLVETLNEIKRDTHFFIIGTRDIRTHSFLCRVLSKCRALGIEKEKR